MLTQQELQSLKANLKRQISELHENICLDKQMNKDLYERCDPDDKVNGEFWFDSLNYYRDCIRKQNQELKKLVGIQKSIKKALASKKDDSSFRITGDFTFVG